VVVGSVGDGRELLAEAERLHPDVIVLDITMPGLDGIEAARQLRRSHRSARMVFPTVHEDPDFARAALDAGGLGSALLVSNAVLGFYEEHEASNALAALKGALARKARALRDGRWIEVDAPALVLGDIVRLRLGDVTPADATHRRRLPQHRPGHADR
jgi:CheY-like chemotaxis protein